MPDLDHPVWCSLRRCTADRLPLHGHPVAQHRSDPASAGQLVLCLVQTPRSPIPAVELSRLGGSVVVPLAEASSVAAALGDLLRLAGVRL